MRRFGLRADQPVRGLSRGEHVKALLLLALARRPRLLILDEPTSGLDPVARQELLSELMEIVRDDSRSILFSSHNTMDVERISDQIAFLDRGRLVDVRDKETFLERWRRLQVDLPAECSLPALPGIVAQTREGRLATLITNHFQPAQVAAVEQAGGRVHEVQRMSLEEIFVASMPTATRNPVPTSKRAKTNAQGSASTRHFNSFRASSRSVPGTDSESGRASAMGTAIAADAAAEFPDVIAREDDSTLQTLGGL